MKTRKRSGLAFTIVELLVVISIVGVLITLLLPSLTTARDVAIKVSCLSNKKQLGAAAISFAADNKLVLPSPIVRDDVSSSLYGSFVNGFYTPQGWTWGGQPFVSTFFPQYRSCFINSQAVLGVNGYVTDINLFFCGSWTRNPAATPTSGNLYAQWWPDATPIRKATWDLAVAKTYTNNYGTDIISPTTELWYTDFYPGTGYQPGVANEVWMPNMSRLDYIESYWNTASPWGSHNYGTAPNGRGAYSPALFCDTNLTSQWGWSSNTPYYGSCHVNNLVRTGVNCVFFDGSGRWVSREEVLNNSPVAGADALQTDYALLGSFNRWSRLRLTIGKQ